MARTRTTSAVLILAAGAGCGMVDRLAPRDLLAPGPTIRLPGASPGALAEPPPECHTMRPDWYCGDFNLDGGVDGADLEAFIVAWSDGLPGTDCDGDGIAGTECDLLIFWDAWAWGEMQGCF